MKKLMKITGSIVATYFIWVFVVAAHGFITEDYPHHVKLQQERAAQSATPRMSHQ